VAELQRGSISFVRVSRARSTMIVMAFVNELRTKAITIMSGGPRLPDLPA
jgi:hypothetical protein